MNRLVLRLLIIFPLFFFVGESHSQFDDILNRIPKQLPGLDQILQRGPAITTNLNDAVYGVPFLDDFNPSSFRSLDSLERTSEGYLIFTPGLYQFDVQSFCLKAATFAPIRRAKKSGYLYAPTKGPRADIVKNIIRRSFNHPEIDQQDIQVLLWAIISYTKLSDMSLDRKLTAAKLLTPVELVEANDGALGLTREDLLDSALDQLPSEASQVLRAEAALRNLLTQAHSTYEEIERIAVLAGNPPQVEDEALPYARWSLRPEGFYIRYFPHGYAYTTVEIYVPEIFEIQFDEIGRITLIADDNGNRIETTYDDSLEPVVIDEKYSIRGFAFRSIHFERLAVDKGQENVEAEWEKIGWTFVGMPAESDLVNHEFEDRFPGVLERYKWAQKHRKQLAGLDEQFNPKGDVDVVKIIMNLGHFSAALREVVETPEIGNVEWADEHLELVKRAWQFAVWLREMYTDLEGESGHSYLGNDAVHRDTTSRRQRLAMRLFISRMNWHNFLGFEDYYSYLRRHPRGLLKPMSIAGRVCCPRIRGDLTP